MDIPDEENIISKLQKKISQHGKKNAHLGITNKKDTKLDHNNNEWLPRGTGDDYSNNHIFYQC